MHCLEHEWATHLPFCRMHRADPKAGPALATFRKLCDSVRPAIVLALPSAFDVRRNKANLRTKLLLLDFAFDLGDPSSFALEDAALIELDACASTPQRSRGDDASLFVRAPRRPR